MSKAVNSPTARLLQSSRLFSLPRPLPAPDLGSAVSGTFRSSDTATTPYPTHQAIATPASSLHRGDWGLKRSLPQKRLRGTKPTVRIRAQDTWEHVTSFESAGDHVRTLEKWGEMGIPMLVKKDESRGGRPVGVSYNSYMKPESVYDEVHDVTDKDAAGARTGQGRWKYSGPWLSGMQEGEFQQWMLRQVTNRHGEWLEFLRSHEAERRARQAFTEAREQGNTLSAEELAQLRTTSRPTDAELIDIQKQLRDDHAINRLSSDLTALITTFLDLPGIAAEEQRNPGQTFIDSAKLLAGMATEKGPPVTHPGAGISHIRTDAIMENHPIHGPQAARTPVEARVVRPHITAGMATEHYAKLGVGGVVANDTISQTLGSDISRHRRGGMNDVAHSMDPKIEGGGKVWVQPRSASVDEKGRIILKTTRADREAIAVKTGDVEEIHEQKRQGDADAGSAPPGGSTFGGRRDRGGGGARYGTALPDTRRMRQRPNVEGFDNELKHGEDQATGVADILRRGLL